MIDYWRQKIEVSGLGPRSVSGYGNQAIRGSGIDPMANDAFSMSSVFSEALMLFEKTKPIFLSPGSQSHDDNLYKFVSLWLSGEKRVKSYQKLSKNYKNAQKLPKTASIFTIPCRKKPNYHVDPRSPAAPFVSLGDKLQAEKSAVQCFLKIGLHSKIIYK